MSSGSSPRVRGTPRHVDVADVDHRFIPACAGNSTKRPPQGIVGAVHPRVCGELATTLRLAVVEHRFIPACAGNSRSSCRWPPCTPVHPRVCGELRNAVALTQDSTGSSPRVRGTLQLVAQAAFNDRFIPACAGNSRRQPSAWLPRSVHPRVCGELSTKRAVRAPHYRFIPACAGNSIAAWPVRCWRGVHPRVCGELPRWALSRGYDRGSSPRVRGTPGRIPPPPPLRRFIPACAGNSSRWTTGPQSPSVHPRVCGELAPHRAVEFVHVRFIPACAGNSTTNALRRRATPVHPRVCGELTPAFVGGVCIDGSSPRVRGTPLPRVKGRPRLRFIPACAGNSAARRCGLAPLPVHPRVCGELQPPKTLVRSPIGSSPRVRGTREL